MPCGTGKSLTSVLIAKDYKNIVLISPLISHSEQFMDYYRKELNDSTYNFILINSQSGTRDKDKIKKSLSKNDKNVLSFTYDSVDILLDLLNLDNLIIIVDEFHNLSLTDLEDDSSAFYKIFYSDVKILFLSATPKFFNSVEDYQSEQIFGTDSYNLPMSKAIIENYICDYHIFLPDIQSKITIDEIIPEISIENLNIDLAIKAKFILRGLLETGSKKCIIYLRDQDEVKSMIETITKLNEYFYMDLYVDGIISETAYIQRFNILKEFSLFSGFSIICSVRIMDEAIDLPNCDSVFITYPSESKIRNIQRISRAIRKDSFNIHKKANVFLWCDEFSDISVFLYQLKTFDDTFVENKVSILNCNGNDGQILDRNASNKDIYDDLDDFIIGIRKFGFGIDAWKKRLNELKIFIELNKRKPLSKAGLTNEEKSMGKWIEYQIHNYKKTLEIMKLPEIRALWDNFTTDYEDLFEENDSIWYTRLKEVENFILVNKKIPSQSNSETSDNKKLAKWVVRNNEESVKRVKCMKDESIFNKWNEFKITYKVYFQQKTQSNLEEWFVKFTVFKKFMDDNKRLPKESTDKDEANLRIWLRSNIEIYEKNKFEGYPDKLKEFEKILPTINSYMNTLTNHEIWINNLKSLESYYLKFKKLPPEKFKVNPSATGKDLEEQESFKALGTWKSNLI